MRPVNRRYLVEFLSAMAAYTVVMVTVWPWAVGQPSTGARLVGAIAPMIPLLFAARALVRRVLGGDELEQRVQLVAAAVAAGVVGLGTMTLGFLASARVVEVPGQAFTLVLPALIMVWGLTLGLVSRRYGGAPEEP